MADSPDQASAMALIERLEAAVWTFDPDDGDDLANRAVAALLPDILAALRSDVATIAGLREKVRVLREAVKVFANVATFYDPPHSNDGEIALEHVFTIATLRRARDAYAATESKPT